MSDFRIDFEGGLNDRERYEMETRGYRSHITVTIEDKTYPVVFYDSTRLSKDLEVEHIIAEPGLIVIESVTEENITRAIAQVIKEGFFDNLKPK